MKTRRVRGLVLFGTLQWLSIGASALPNRFPDYGFQAPPGPSSLPNFVLSQNYPAMYPDLHKLPPFFTKLPRTISNTDFAGWHDYMMAVRDYCFEGNLEIDWRVQENKVRKWYHMPWQHYGDTGRESIHGLTKEAPVEPGQFAATQGRPTPTENYQAYAIGFFNDFGGYTIGQVWKDHSAPSAGKAFLEGTVIAKLLFVDVPSEQVPSLANPVQWMGYIQKTYQQHARSVRPLNLIQMDVAIKDRRAPHLWLFGTFQYNGQLGNKVGWQNLVPVGIMWGNDPTITDSTYTNPTPTETKINPNLKESAINPNPKELPPTHLGWNGRLNGPVDNPRSSCLSCHMTAEFPALSAMSPLFTQNPPPVGSQDWMRWFQNKRCGVAFDAPKAKTADFSLQLAISLQNFEAYTLGSGIYSSSAKPMPPDNLSMAPSEAARAAKEIEPTSHGEIIHPIVRDVLSSEPPK